MHVIGIKDTGRNFTYQWPDGSIESYDCFVEYVARAEDGQHDVKVGFGKRFAYGKDRVRVVVWIDGHPHAEFLGTEDFENSGEVVSEIKIPGTVGERICRYPDEPIPERYSMFHVEGLPIRIQGSGVHGAWAVVANIADHKTLIALAALRRFERMR